MTIETKDAILWKKFYTLTKEMHRFIKKNDVDMFFSLLQQRMDLQKMLEDIPNKTYHQTDDGRELLTKINMMNVKIKALSQSWLIRMRNRNNKVRSYDYMAGPAMGNIFNKKL
ncbi:hypothetical protein [Pectinatus brassicae]|uniref:Flagellar protein FliT n=1 Tax=Pectinatus brassicae TaxID=862415 RepID=A0A840UVI9_9FIRM|nr:hypothetical protein [Pectinatus brassicae]MBB5336834.1 hypothetical protein [Pectinatus brassicae]